VYVLEMHGVLQRIGLEILGLGWNQ